MSSLLPLRISLVLVLICSLVVSGLFNLTTRRSYASNNSLLRSSNPSGNESSEKTAPQAKTLDEATRSRVHEAYGKLPLSFEENRGQVDGEVKYISRASGYTLFLTATEAVLVLRRSEERQASTTDARRSRFPAQPRPTLTSVVRMKLSGASQSPVVTGESKMGVTTNYFIGNDPAKWRTDVARYERVRYSQVYPGVDMIYYGRQRQLEYDFEVAPGADARQIALEFEGVQQVKVEQGTGDLVLQTAGGEVRQRKPVAYQEVGGKRRKVVSRYVVKGASEVGIDVRGYDRTKSLVIDPVLSYSSYLSSNSQDYGYGIAVDSSGHTYVTGYTCSTDFPKRNQHRASQGSSDAFVTKLKTNAKGAASLLYTAYLGGSGNDYGAGIAVDTSGHAYATGSTSSADFPTRNQYQTNPASRQDAFVTKLDTNASGKASLVYSTYLGGNNSSLGTGIAVDSSGNAYVTGVTDATDFPVLKQYQTDPNDRSSDLFVTKLNTKASGKASLLYSTYLGGSDEDYGSGIAIDASGQAYVTGSTRSTDFPLLNQYQTDQAGADAFVAGLNTKASGVASLIYSTYLGGSNEDYGSGIAVDASSVAYITGDTTSTDLPLLNQYQTDPNDGRSDAFVMKLDTKASGVASLLYSTYLGGNDSDRGFGIAVDASSVAYVTGVTDSNNFPVLKQYQGDQKGTDLFVTKLDTKLSGAASLTYSTYLGGDNYEEGLGIAVDASGQAFVTGFTRSTDFPKLRQHKTALPDDGAFVTQLTESEFYTISGYVTDQYGYGLDGVQISLYGSQTDTAYTDYYGDFIFEYLPAGGDYTVSPSGSYTFEPEYHEFYDLQYHASAGFRAVPGNSYTISGYVMRSDYVPIRFAGVELRGDFDSWGAETDSDGYYSFKDVPGGASYTVTPYVEGVLAWEPEDYSIYNLESNEYAYFYSAPVTLSGTVRTRDNGIGLAGVKLNLSAQGSTTAYFDDRNVMTGSDGSYSFTDVPVPIPVPLHITPYVNNFQFDPEEWSGHVRADVTDINFEGRRKLYSISGVVKLGANGLPGVTVKLSSPTWAGFTPRTTTTDSAGAYSFNNVQGARNYTVTVQKTGYQFTYASQSFANLSANRTGVNFAVKVHSITGWIKRAGTSGGISAVTVTVTSPTPAGFPARTGQTGSAGYYKFFNLPAGRNYTIKPSKSGYTFSPATRSITNLSNDLPAGAATNFAGTGP